MLSTAFLQQVTLRPGIEAADWARYPLALPAIRQLGTLKLHPRVSFFVGENGSGKSTLLEALAVSLGFNPEGGSRNFSFNTRATHSTLHEHLRVAKGVRRPRTGYFLRAESFYNVATEIERLDAEPSYGPPVADSYGERALHAQSHGESFLALMLHRFEPQGLYLLDEPEAALSPQRQLTVLARIHELAEQGSQFVIATRSPILMACPQSTIFHFSGTGVAPVAYEDTEHVRVTRAFMQAPERMLRELLAGPARGADPGAEAGGP